MDARLSVDVGSLQVVRGEGGVIPLSAPEKMLVRSNALRSLDARKYTRIIFVATVIEKSADGYRLRGSLTIHGKTRPQTVDVGVDDRGDSWRLVSETVITQSDFGMKPYSQLLGAVKVSDDVTVSFDATRAKEV